MNRYTLHIYMGCTPKDNIKESFKTLKEAKKYISIVDKTCIRAYIEDNVTSLIVIDIK